MATSKHLRTIIVRAVNEEGEPVPYALLHLVVYQEERVLFNWPKVTNNRGVCDFTDVPDGNGILLLQNNPLGFVLTEEGIVKVLPTSPIDMTRHACMGSSEEMAQIGVEVPSTSKRVQRIRIGPEPGGSVQWIVDRRPANLLDLMVTPHVWRRSLIWGVAEDVQRNRWRWRCLPPSHGPISFRALARLLVGVDKMIGIDWRVDGVEIKAGKVTTVKTRVPSFTKGGGRLKGTVLVAGEPYRPRPDHERRDSRFLLDMFDVLQGSLLPTPFEIDIATLDEKLRYVVHPDRKGRFQLSGLEPGRYKIQAICRLWSDEEPLPAVSATKPKEVGLSSEMTNVSVHFPSLSQVKPEDRSPVISISTL